jgi:hypothetical protein
MRAYTRLIHENYVRFFFGWKSFGPRNTPTAGILAAYASCPDRLGLSRGSGFKYGFVLDVHLLNKCPASGPTAPSWHAPTEGRSTYQELGLKVFWLVCLKFFCLVDAIWSQTSEINVIFLLWPL